jgi:hypothetical protein
MVNGTEYFKFIKILIPMIALQRQTKRMIIYSILVT